MDNYIIEEDFDLEIIASEPLLNAPVAIDFDDQGRVWSVQMPGYMSNLEGMGEDEPSGSIRILEDRDEDGVMDHAKVFLDSLVMPRALAHVYGGLLYAEPPNLWFVEMENDRPGKRTLVDSLYAPEGNPEYQPNGLVLNIDNWIYSAKHPYRYQRNAGKWHKEPTSQRGQWGITHDNIGRLYYNDNARQLLGDYLLPNLLVRNKYIEPRLGVNRLLTDDQRLYPLHPTSVNRGYAPGVLDNDSILKEVTSACSPLVYRGSTFPTEYDQNVFVCAPEGNLIKRNLIAFHGDSISAEQAWQGKEFLASTDEGFRPVALNNGPDGSMYVVDMHRGAIQHYAFLSPYLKKQLKEKKLDTVLGMGRILRISNKNAQTPSILNFENASTTELVERLKHKNGWVRDRAQHYLIFQDRQDAIPQLVAMVNEKENPYSQIHSLRTLDGLDALSFDILKEAVIESKPDVVAHAIVLLENFITAENVAQAEMLFQSLLNRNEKSIDLYLATTLGTWAKIDKGSFTAMAGRLYQSYPENRIVQEALLSGLGETAKDFLAEMDKNSEFENSDFQSQITKILERKKQDELNPIYTETAQTMDTRTKGAKLYRQICAACHGYNGEGAEGLAPPLMNSEYVSGSPERLALIMLHGLTGPVHVNGKRYEINQAMPGLSENPDLSDKDIADVITYVTNAFSRKPSWIKPERIDELRDKKPKDGGEYTEEELLQYAAEKPLSK
ncbi:MAG: c-type cytochrome [Pricia sp.]